MDASLKRLIETRQPHSILILGASDTGKTTLLEQCLTDWHPGQLIAVVDCDVGQSHLGPPTTIGWGLVEGGFRGWSHVPVRGMAFTGDVSPEGNLEGFLQATLRIVQEARQAADWLLVDTTGLATGELGKALKSRKLELIRPDLILAIQREKELEELLACLPQDAIQRLTASPACVRRSLAERAAYRDMQFARYFANSAKQHFSLERLTLIGLGANWQDGRVTLSPELLIDRVVGLQGAHGEDVGLGLIRELDVEKKRLTVFTPLRDVSSIRSVCVGSVRWPV